MFRTLSDGPNATSLWRCITHGEWTSTIEIQGERLYMAPALWLNTYGTPDGGNIWQAERNAFVMEHFNKGCWTVKRCFMDQYMFYFNYFTDEPIGPDEMEEAKVRCGGVEKFEQELVRGDTSLQENAEGRKPRARSVDGCMD